jgi:hypothetical protein
MTPEHVQAIVTAVELMAKDVHRMVDLATDLGFLAIQMVQQARQLIADVESLSSQSETQEGD